MAPTPIKKLISISGNYRVVKDGKFTRMLDDAHCVKHGDVRICEVLAGLAAHTFKTWCFPTQEKICELVERFTGRSMSVRTLNRHLNALERDWYLHRTRRIRAEKHKGIVCRSTLYAIGATFSKRIGRIVTAWKRWNLGQKFMTDLRGELRSGIRLPYLAEHGTSSILRL
jgi:hypothetical protein